MSYFEAIHPGSSNGRTGSFGLPDRGSNPCPGTLNKWLIILVVLGILIFSFFFLNLENTGTISNRISFLTLVVLFFTFLELIKYADETSRLRKESEKQTQELVKQTDFEMRPYLRLQFDNKTNKESDEKIVFTIANDGRGLAKGVTFEEFTYSSVDDKMTRLLIQSRPVISSGGSSTVSERELSDSFNVIGEDNRDFNFAKNISCVLGKNKLPRGKTPRY